MRRLAHIPITVALAAAVLAPSLPAHAQQLSYRLPSPATATYHMVDSTTASMVSIDGVMEAGGSSVFTYAVTFQSDDAGVRVSAELTNFAAESNEPMSGTSALTAAEAGVGDFELVLGPGGVVEVGSPSVASTSDLPLLSHPHTLFFPDLPDGELDAGGTWTQTTTTDLGNGGDKVVEYTYTVSGDETVDGRTYLRVEVVGDGTVGMADAPGDLTGEEIGFLLWDRERGLVASMEISHNYKATLPAPGGAGTMSLTLTATTRVTLEN